MISLTDWQLAAKDGPGVRMCEVPAPNYPCHQFLGDGNPEGTTAEKQQYTNRSSSRNSVTNLG
jgi:hypothetical protein